jgi:hypothetical protein
VNGWTVTTCTRLVELGLAPNDWLIHNNGTLSPDWNEPLPEPWSRPSRLYRFPIEVREVGSMWDDNVRIGLMHPLLGDHPFVRRVEELLGFQLCRDGAPNYAGYSKAPATWWHAGDLLTVDLEHLFETRHFTTDDDIARAVALALESKGRFTPRQARRIMVRLEIPEPSGRSRGAIEASTGKPTSHCDDGGTKGPLRWPLNLHARDAAAAAWAMIHGLEDGLFEYASHGYAEWSERGRSWRAGAAPVQGELLL